MSMKKILMAAVAVSALTAGAASAATISSATLNGPAAVVWDGTTATPYKLANETIFGTGLSTTATAGDNTVVAKVAAGRLGVGTYTVTYDYSGPAGFQAALTNSSVSADRAGTCLLTPTLVSGGLLGGKTVTYSLAVSGTCTTAAGANQGPQSFTLDAPLKVTALGDVAVTAAFSQGGVSIDNGGATARTLITNAAGFTASIAADTLTTQWALGTGVPYRALTPTVALTSDDVIGSYTLSGSGTVFVDAAGAQAASAQNLSADLAASGNFTNLTVNVSGAGAGPLVSVTPFTAATFAGATNAVATRSITVAPTVANTASQTNRAFSLTLTPKTTSLLFTIPAPVTGALQSIGLEGTNYLAPWVGGSQSSAATSIRLSNSGVATGAVTLQLGAAVYDAGTTAGATTCTSSTLSKLASIATGTELVISNADLTTCFGAFKRGDVTITVQASSTSLTAKARNVNAGTGVVSEISLGAS